MKIEEFLSIFAPVFRTRTRQLVSVCMLCLVWVQPAVSQYQPAMPPVPVAVETANISPATIKNPKESRAILSKPTSRTSFAITAPVVSNRMLINIPHPYTTGGVMVLNASYTASNFGKRRFADETVLGMDAVYMDLNPDNAIAFNLDPFWNKIIYMRKNGSWVKSYGDNPSDYSFLHPRAMAIDVRDTIYVADTDHGKIVKLFVNTGVTPANISLISSFNVLGIDHPIDIAIDQSGTKAGLPANDNIWIADDFTGKLMNIGRNGAIRQVITNYYDPYPTNFRLAHPARIQTQEIGGRLAFIDRDRMAFVILSPPSNIATQSTQFARSSSDLSCIGQDANNEWWVGDQQLRMYHKFTENGTYIASYDASNTTVGQFSSPVTITKAPYYFNGTNIYRSQYVYTSDLWGTSTGERAFFPGTDALNLTFHLNAGSNSCTSSFSFLLTNKSYVKGTLFQIQSDGSTALVKAYDYGVLEAGNQELFVDRNLMGTARYKFNLELKPYYWDFYGLSGIDPWSVYPIVFDATAALSGGGSISTNQSCYNSYQTGVWTFNTGCLGSYSYQWYINYSPGTENWVGLSCTTTQLSFVVGQYYFELKCQITNTVPGGHIGAAYYTNCPPPPPPPPGGGCPYVYTSDGLGLTAENNILPQSDYSGNEGNKVTDYYKLISPPLIENHKCVLEIRELESEKSYLDQLRLIAVDHASDTKIAVQPDGRIVQYKTPFQLELVDKETLQRLMDFDQSALMIRNGAQVSLRFGSVSSSFSPSSFEHQRVGIVLGGWTEHRFEASKLCCKAKQVGTISLPITGWKKGTTPFTFRERPTLIYVPLEGLAEDLSLQFTEDVELDYANLAIEVPSGTTEQEFPLLEASHSHRGSVVDQLKNSDGIVTTLRPGESINFRFGMPSSAPINGTRDFILVSQGKYEHIQSMTQEIPTAYILSQNYPNPFNPMTTIEYAIPEAGRVTLRIYSVLGAEIATLVDGIQDVGYKSIDFDASKLPSGVYFYRIDVYSFAGDKIGKSFSDVKKLLLIK